MHVRRIIIPWTNLELISFHALSGFKLARLEIKLVLAMVFSRFKLEPAVCDKNICWEVAVVTSSRVLGSKKCTHELPIKVSVLPG